MLAIPVIRQHAAGRCRQKHAKVTKPRCRKTLRFDWFMWISQNIGGTHTTVGISPSTRPWRIFGFPNDWKLFLVGQSKDAHGLCFILKHYQHYQRTNFHTNCYFYIYTYIYILYWLIYIYIYMIDIYIYILIDIYIYILIYIYIYIIYIYIDLIFHARSRMVCWVASGRGTWLGCIQSPVSANPMEPSLNWKWLGYGGIS